MSDKLFDKLDEVFDDDEEEEDADTSEVNEAMSNDAGYWKKRNQVKDAQEALSDDDED
jgi:predicted house-cleaning noncanonical NTP pyrophosphatase (MazG superfamily)